MKYLERINRSAEDAAKANNGLVAKESDINLQAAILQKEKEHAALQAQLEIEKSALPLNPDRLLQLQKNVDIVNKSLAYLINLQKELF